MNKKIGKFKLWQLIAAGVALGVIIYIYSRGRGEGASPEELYGGTGTGAFGPIDPDTGVPYAFEGGLGGSGAGGGGAPGLGEVLGTIQQLKDAGLISEPTPEIEHLETVVEREGPEPRTNAEVKSAQMATKAVRGALHKTQARLHKLENKLKKTEHQHTQTHSKTGDSAHAKGTHHSQAHPGGRTQQSKKNASQKAYNNRGQNHVNNQQQQRNGNNNQRQKQNQNQKQKRR